MFRLTSHASRVGMVVCLRSSAQNKSCSLAPSPPRDSQSSGRRRMGLAVFYMGQALRSHVLDSRAWLGLALPHQAHFLRGPWYVIGPIHGTQRVRCYVMLAPPPRF